MKSVLASMLLVAALAAGAQEQKLKKACIKIDTEENGKVTKIDTCVTAATEAELHEKLKALGVAPPPLPPLPPHPPAPPEIDIHIDSLSENGHAYTFVKIITEEGDEGKTGKQGERRKTRIVTRSGEKGHADVYVMDNDGNVTPTGTGGSKVIIKDVEPGADLEEEIEELLKEEGHDAKGNRIIVKHKENKDGKEQHNVKVFVFNKVEVKKLSEAEKKKLPAPAARAIESGRAFTNLVVAPNPTDDACTISYKSSSKEPLQIKVYNEEGKTMLTESLTNTEEEVSKTLSLKGLGRGTYFVHITQGKQSEVRKVIVK